MMWRRPDWLTIPAMAFAIMVVTPLALMITDRTPPYERLGGRLHPAAPDKCNMTDPDAPHGIVPGACVYVDWDIRPLRLCKAAPGFNITRHLVTSNGNRILLGQARSEYPQRSPGSAIIRYFVLPLTTPEGLTVYEAEARFVCNPLQQFVSTYITRALDVVISTPTVRFEVQRPGTMGIRSRL